MVAILAFSIFGAIAWHAHQDKMLIDLQFTSQALPHQGGPDGYVSSDRCEACHPDQYHSWHQSFHRTMTQVARNDTILGRFDPVTLERAGKLYRLEKRGPEFWAELEDPDWALEHPTQLSLNAAPPPARVSRRIGMVTGSHHMQVYWLPTRFGNLQVAFPFAYLLDDQRWVPLKDTFLKDPALPQNQNLWNTDCIKCHSTAGQPKPDYTTHLLDTQVGEFGIACEACHGPAEKHVRANQNPLRRYQLHHLAQGDPTIVNPARLSSKRASQVCGQCHGIKWLPDARDYQQNGFRYRPGDDLSKTAPIVQPTHLAEQPWLAEGLRRQPNFLPEHYWSDGVVRVSGRDYNGLVDSPCYQRGELSCLSCHSMHQSLPNYQVAATKESNEACLQCHKNFRANLGQHTHHDPGSSGSLCYNCHMAYTTYGLLKAIRSHQIESPSVRTSIQTGRPNGCNLCHLDRTLSWTDQHLTNWFGVKPVAIAPEQQTISAAVLWALSGDAGQRALIAWHMGWEPARKASGEKWLAPFLAPLLNDPYAAVRYIAGHSLQRLPGFHDFAYDYAAGQPELLQASQRAVEQWRNAGTPDRNGSPILIEANSKLQEANLDQLLRQRDNHSMDLQE
jgi:predicted CXXCH cytochrome family protein